MKLLIEENGIYIIVKSCNINYIKPASLEDELEIRSNIKEITKDNIPHTTKAYAQLENILNE